MVAGGNSRRVLLDDPRTGRCFGSNARDGSGAAILDAATLELALALHRARAVWFCCLSAHQLAGERRSVCVSQNQESIVRAKFRVADARNPGSDRQHAPKSEP